MMAFVGLGIFMMTPKLLEMIQEALKVPPFKYGSAMGEALQFGWKPIGGVIGKTANAGLTAGKGRFADSVMTGVAAAPGVTNPEDEWEARLLEGAGWRKRK